MSTSGFDPMNMFWKMLLNTQEMNQMALKVFLNTQKAQQSQQTFEQLLQECMLCVGDNTAISMSMLQALGKVKCPEEFVRTQEKLLSEYGEKNLEHTKKFLNIYHNLWQEAYHCTKDNTHDFTERCTEAAANITKNITDNVNKFAETASNLTGTYCNKNSGGGNSTKKHQHSTENN